LLPLSRRAGEGSSSEARTGEGQKWRIKMNKTLYRTEKDKMIGGVCGGLGRYFDLDPTLVRLIFAVIFFGYGAGVMIYILLWIIMPSEEMLEERKNWVANNKDSNKVEVVVTPEEVVENGEEK
jgi:phage shock protein PspC (stress-responsive transcriptional regulator)